MRIWNWTIPAALLWLAAPWPARADGINDWNGRLGSADCALQIVDTAAQSAETADRYADLISRASARGQATPGRPHQEVDCDESP